MGKVNDIVSLLIEMSNEMEDLKKENTALKEHERSVYCVHCGRSLSYKDGSGAEEITEIMKDHDRTCERNPLVQHIRLLEKKIEFNGENE